jgi:DNA-directed RNA polymerase specialized sigma24 family protein
MGASKRDTTKIERQFDGHYALSTATGVKLLLADYHAFQARQFLGDYDAVVVLADLAEAIRLAGLTGRQAEALALVYYEDLTQMEAGRRLGIAQNTLSEALDRACEAIADVYYYWASHGEGYSVTSEFRSERADDNDEQF